MLPAWVQRLSTTGELVQAAFSPCSCTRGTPPKVVCQEKVRYGPRGAGRTVEQATEILIEKVTRTL